jgi:hypothetical protein
MRPGRVNWGGSSATPKLARRACIPCLSTKSGEFCEPEGYSELGYSMHSVEELR